MVEIQIFNKTIQALFRLCFVDFVKMKTIGNIIQNGQMGKQGVVLIDDSYSPFFGR